MANETDQAFDKKTLILAEAERIFAEKGYYGLGLSELLKSCDVPKGSFYYYFPGGKKQLLQEALEFSAASMGISSWKKRRWLLLNIWRIASLSAWLRVNILRRCSLR